jgi:hypothetical protein
MVKCAECGYLAIRNRFTRGLDEAEQSYRDTGEVERVPSTRPIDQGSLPFAFDRFDELNERWPICLAHEFDLRSLAYAKAKSK